MDIEVRIGEIALTKGKDTLTASGVGSCVIIALYDPKLKIGALAHALLPSRDGEGRPTEKGNRIRKKEIQNSRYTDIAIHKMLKKMESQGTKKEDLEAKIVGGANMFSAFESDIGSDNVLSAKKKLKKEGIKIAGECVGGSQGRSVEFSLASGIVTVKTKF